MHSYQAILGSFLAALPAYRNLPQSGATEQQEVENGPHSSTTRRKVPSSSNTARTQPAKNQQICTRKSAWKQHRKYSYD